MAEMTHINREDETDLLKSNFLLLFFIFNINVHVPS